MSGLRKHVAEAIRAMQEQGGAGILRDEEISALEQGVRSIAQERLAHSEHSPAADELKEHMLALCGIKSDLGPHPVFMHGEPRRIDAYWLKCADVAIEAYDEWLEKRAGETP
jgi:hypothetical protein